MKPMTNSRARALGKKLLRRIFRELRIKDGLGDDPIAGDEFSYWYNRERDGFRGNYLVYEVIDSEPTHRADDCVIGRDFFCQIDMFSIRSFESKQLTGLISQLEDRLTDYGFEVNMQGEGYEPDTRLYHQILFVSKLFI
jgi:hypothetical protein